MPGRNTVWAAGTFPAISAGTAGFRTVVAEVEAHLVNAGLVKVECTGQIDLASFVLPVGFTTSTQYGFSVFRLNDSRQAQAPVFLRLDYGIGLTLGVVHIWARAGTTCSSTGVLGGRVTSQILANVSSASHGNTPAGGYAYSGGTNARFGFVGMLTNGGDNNFLALVIERTKSVTGGDTNAGFVLVAGLNVQYVPFSTAVPALPPAEGNWHAQVASATSPQHLNLKSVGLITPFNGDTANPLVSIGVGNVNDFQPSETLFANVYEQAAEYFVVPHVYSRSLIASGSTTFRLLLRQN